MAYQYLASLIMQMLNKGKESSEANAADVTGQEQPKNAALDIKDIAKAVVSSKIGAGKGGGLDMADKSTQSLMNSNDLLLRGTEPSALQNTTDAVLSASKGVEGLVGGSKGIDSVLQEGSKIGETMANITETEDKGSLIGRTLKGIGKGAMSVGKAALSDNFVTSVIGDISEGRKARKTLADNQEFLATIAEENPEFAKDSVFKFLEAQIKNKKPLKEALDTSSKLASLFDRPAEKEKMQLDLRDARRDERYEIEDRPAEKSILASEMDLKAKQAAGYESPADKRAEDYQQQVDLAEKKAGIQVTKEVEAKKQKAVWERKVNAGRLQSQLLRSQENYTDMINEQKRIQPGWEPKNRASMISLWLSGKLGTNKAVAKFEGDLITTAITAGKISSPSARVGPQFIEYMQKTIGDTWKTPQETTGNLLQSASDTFEAAAWTDWENFFTAEQLELPQEDLQKIMRTSVKGFQDTFKQHLDAISGGTEKEFIEGKTKTGTAFSYKRVG